MFRKENKAKFECPELLYDETLSRSFESLFYIQNTRNLNDFIDEYEWYAFRDYYTMTDFAKQAPLWQNDLHDSSKAEKKMIEFFTSLDIGMWIECRLDKYSLMDCQEWKIHRNERQLLYIEDEETTSKKAMKNFFFKPYFILNMQFNNPNDDVYGRLIAPGRKVGRFYHYSSDAKPMYLYSIKLLSQDGEIAIIRPKTSKGNFVCDNIDGCLASFEHFLYDSRGVPKVLPIGCTTLLCNNENSCNSISYNDHMYNYNDDGKVFVRPRKKWNENKIDTVWTFNLIGSLIVWCVNAEWYILRGAKHKFTVVSNYGNKQNWNIDKVIGCNCNIWYYVSRMILINRQLNQAFIELNVDRRDLNCLVFNWYKKYWHFATTDNCPNWLRTQNGFDISPRNDIINAKFCCQISDALLLLSKNSFDKGINYDNFTNNVKNNSNVNQVPMSPYIYVSDCKTFSQRKKDKKNKKDCENSGNITNRSFDEVVIYSFFKTNYSNYFTKYSGFIDDIFGIISKYYGIVNMHSCNIVSCVNDRACMIGFCGSATRINVNYLILENHEMYPQIIECRRHFAHRVVTMNDAYKTSTATITNNFYEEKWYGIDWHGYMNTYTKSSSTAPVMLLFGLLRHNDDKLYDDVHMYREYDYMGERCFSGIEIGCLNDNDNYNYNCNCLKTKKWKITCFENDHIKEMSNNINGDDKIKDNQILRVGDNLEMKVLFKSNSIEIYFYKNRIPLFENQSCLNMNMQFGKIDNGCNFEAIVKWYKYNKINQDDCASIITKLSFHNYYNGDGAVSHPFSFQLFDYNSSNSPPINGKSKITANYDAYDEFDYYGMGDGWEIKIHGVYIE